jgi:hypothetical protein
MNKQVYKEIKRFKSVAEALRLEGWSVDRILNTLINHLRLKEKCGELKTEAEK